MNDFPIFNKDSLPFGEPLQEEFPFEFKREVVILNDFISLVPVVYDEPISVHCESFDSDLFSSPILKELREAYEIIDNGQPTDVIIYFLQDMDIFEMIELLIVPKEFSYSFNEKYKKYFISPEIKNTTAPF